MRLNNLRRRWSEGGRCRRLDVGRRHKRVLVDDRDAVSSTREQQGADQAGGTAAEDDDAHANHLPRLDGMARSCTQRTISASPSFEWGAAQ
jgi:hypothetical protein